MVDHADGNDRPGAGLQALLKRAAEDGDFRTRLIARRDELASEMAVTLTASEIQVLASVDDDALARMIDGLASSRRAQLEAPAPSSSDQRPVSTGIAPDLPPPVTRGISPDMPPWPVVGIGPDMPPDWKGASRRRRWLLALVLLLVLAAALGWWLTRR